MTVTAAAAGGSGGDAAAADAPFPSLVSAEWLLQQPRGEVKLLDATWYMPNAGKDAVAEFRAERIPGARFFGAAPWNRLAC